MWTFAYTKRKDCVWENVWNFPKKIIQLLAVHTHRRLVTGQRCQN
jgi:hypothetical protein